MIGNKSFGISSSLRHICAMCVPGDISYFKYDWKVELWNVFFVVGILTGGFLASELLAGSKVIDLSSETRQALGELGITDFNHYLPNELFDWSNLTISKFLVFVLLGGFLVGFGTRYAHGCTSGHSITGLSNLQWASLVATISFFIGGLVMTHFILPHII
jgi:uncharacterized membrane protein YedE/YeeE